MKKTKFLVGIVLAFSVLVAQAGAVFAAPALHDSPPITGRVQSITLKTDSNTGVTTVLVTLLNNGTLQSVRISLETAIALGLMMRNGDGNPLINDSSLGQLIEIDPKTALSDKEQNQHPVGNALATFFSDIPDLNYDAIMAAHNKGIGFGVIAQSLWMTRKLKGDAEVFLAILEARESGDYRAFVLEDGAIPKNWEQFKKAVMDGSKKGGPGVVMAGKDKDNGNINNNENAKDKDQSNNGNNKDRDKDKDEDKGKGNNK